MWLLLWIIIDLSHILDTEGHGRLLEPPSRASMWRSGYDTPHNYLDNQLFCGGFTNQWQIHGGKCGVCGDPWQGPREHEAGGKYANGIITRQYSVSSVILVVVEITAPHRGWFEFRICPNNDFYRAATWDCLNRHVLPLADGSGTRYYVTPTYPMKHEILLELPKGLECSQCVIQWMYNAGNNWGTDENGTSCIGCGSQEQFYACADVTIGDVVLTTTAAPVINSTDGGSDGDGKSHDSVDGNHRNKSIENAAEKKNLNAVQGNVGTNLRDGVTNNKNGSSRGDDHSKVIGRGFINDVNKHIVKGVTIDASVEGFTTPRVSTYTSGSDRNILPNTLGAPALSRDGEEWRIKQDDNPPASRTELKLVGASVGVRNQNSLPEAGATVRQKKTSILTTNRNLRNNNVGVRHKVSVNTRSDGLAISPMRVEATVDDVLSSALAAPPELGPSTPFSVKDILDVFFTELYSFIWNTNPEDDFAYTDYGNLDQLAEVNDLDLWGNSQRAGGDQSVPDTLMAPSQTLDWLRFQDYERDVRNEAMAHEQKDSSNIGNVPDQQPLAQAGGNANRRISHDEPSKLSAPMEFLGNNIDGLSRREATEPRRELGSPNPSKETPDTASHSRREWANFRDFSPYPISSTTDIVTTTTASPTTTATTTTTASTTTTVTTTTASTPTTVNTIERDTQAKLQRKKKLLALLRLGAMVHSTTPMRNSWGVEADGRACVGCGNQEQFYGCADVAIGQRPPLPTYHRPPMPSPRTTPGDVMQAIDVWQVPLRYSTAADDGDQPVYHRPSTTPPRVVVAWESWRTTTAYNGSAVTEYIESKAAIANNDLALSVVLIVAFAVL